MSLMFTLLAFLLALGVLIVVHEFGHFIIARWCGVKVLRFCVGFGKPIYSRRFSPDGTEWALAAFPLGGYVKMLDEREGPVEAHELHRAFNRKSVGQRMAVVVAGPMANLLLAILLYCVLFMQGTTELRPVMGKPIPGSMAEWAGFNAGEIAIRLNGESVATWQDFRWLMLKNIVDKAEVQVETQNSRNEIQIHHLDFTDFDDKNLGADPLAHVGLRYWQSPTDPVIVTVVPGSPAEQAGLKVKDKILRIDDQEIHEGGDIIDLIGQRAGRPALVTLEREGRILQLQVQPKEEKLNGVKVGRIGIALPKTASQAADNYFVVVQHGPIQALALAAEKTWDTSWFSLKMMGRMVTGQVSWRNLSGPVTIAEYAGKSAHMGLTPYLNFIALISISLGVLNLLPIPLLDGGHLMYYTAEIFRGSPVSERAMEIGQQIGLAILIMLMAFAFYNDVNRLVSG